MSYPKMEYFKLLKIGVHIQIEQEAYLYMTHMYDMAKVVIWQVRDYDTL